MLQRPVVRPQALQVVDALIDQRLHGPEGAAAASTSDIVQDVYEEHSVFPFVPGTCPQARCRMCSFTQRPPVCTRARPPGMIPSPAWRAGWPL